MVVTPALRVLLASLGVIAVGLGIFAEATGSFRAFTTESARRLSVSQHPRVIPDVTLETSEGDTLTTQNLRGRWWLVDFVYTRCETYCVVQGAQFAHLQDRLADPIAKGSVGLLSISFDPEHDGPAELAMYKHHSGDHGHGWYAVRPLNASSLASLTQTFGITAIPDGMGGFIHNAAINVVDPEGRLIAITDWDAPLKAEELILAGLKR